MSEVTDRWRFDSHLVRDAVERVRLLAERTDFCDGGAVSHIEAAAAIYWSVQQADSNTCPIDRIYWSSRFSQLVTREVLAEVGAPEPGKAAVPLVFSRPLGIAAGSALDTKIHQRGFRVLCVMSEEDQFDGHLWEAAQFASSWKLGNLTGLVIEEPLPPGRKKGERTAVHVPSYLADKYASFGWQVLLTRADDVAELIAMLNSVESISEQPTVLIADRSPARSRTDRRQEAEVDTGFLSGLRAGLKALTATIDGLVLFGTRDDAPAIYACLADIPAGGRPPVITASSLAGAAAAATGAVLTGGTPVLLFREESLPPYDLRRIFDTVDAQIYKLMGVRLPGGRETAVPDLKGICGVTGIRVEIPADPHQTEGALLALASHPGPGLLICSRGSSMDLPRSSQRFTGAKAEFIRGCENALAGPGPTLVSVGPVLNQLSRAARILSESHGIDVSILNPHTLKPLDTGTLRRALNESGGLVLVEDASIRGFGRLVDDSLKPLDGYGPRHEPIIVDLGDEGLDSDLAVDLIVVKAVEIMENRTELQV